MTTDTILNLDSADFESVVLQSDIPVLIDFWAEWCQPCNMLSPTIQKLAEQYGDRVTVAKVNIDDNQDLAAAHSITSIPTVLVFNAGEETERLVGMQSLDAYVKALNIE